MIQTTYDVIKAHGGEIRVESPPALSAEQAGGQAGKAGEGSEFIVQLPIV